MEEEIAILNNMCVAVKMKSPNRSTRELADEPLYIGITGLPASGKGTVKDLLIDAFNQRGLKVHFFSMSDEVRREAAKLNPAYNREDLRNISLSLKRTFGSGILALRAMEDVQHAIEAGAQPKVVVTEAIRNIGEVETFRTRLGRRFLLLAVIAPIEALIERILERRRYDENGGVLSDRAKILEMIEKELGESESEYGHQIGKCIEAADVVLRNVRLEELKTQIDIFIEERVTLCVNMG